MKLGWWWTTERRTRHAGFGLRLLESSDAYEEFVASLG